MKQLLIVMIVFCVLKHVDNLNEMCLCLIIILIKHRGRYFECIMSAGTAVGDDG